LPDESTGHYAPLERVSRELVSEEWQGILDKAWSAGIPHVIFTGGEPTLRPDLCQLIAYAEKLGMVSGLITNGLRLAENKYLHELLQSGLDHVMILLDPEEEQSWEAVRDTLAEDIAVTVHLTLTQRVLPRFDEILDRLVKMNVQNFSLSAESLDLKDELKALQAQVAERQVRLVWDLPVPYSHNHPVALELAEEIPDVDVSITGPGKAWVYVEPDGDVLPGQGHYQNGLGNLLEEPWETIWQNAGQHTAQK
jgi:MoaA/NifB/PqqE/SkfB family radical SAM enzyme